MSDDNKKRKGLICPNCGCEDFRDEMGRPWDCVKTRPIFGAIRRRKICRYCGTVVRTKETIEKVYEKKDKNT